MPDLHFAFEKVEVEPFAVTPQLAFKLRLTNHTPDETIHTVALRAQVQIESHSPPIQLAGAGEIARPFWRARTLGPDA